MKRQLLILAFVIVSGSANVTPRLQTTENENVTLQKPFGRPDNCPPCQCGILRPRHRLPLDRGSSEIRFPWMVELLKDGSLLCGGTLLNDLYVLTSGVCALAYNEGNFTARFLEHDRSVEYESKTVDLNILAVILHPQYNVHTYDNDIALLRLNKRVDLRNAVKRTMNEFKSTSIPANSVAEVLHKEKENFLRPVCLPTPELSYSNYNGVVTGWGRTDDNGPVSDVLKVVNVTIMSNQDCRSSAFENAITDNMLCAVEPVAGKDSCNGDAGGPLHVLNSKTKQLQQVGIVSWGEGCARPGIPGVYVRVNRYLEWIHSNTRDACTCN